VEGRLPAGMGAADWTAIRPNLATVAEAADWWQILHGHVEREAPAEDRAFLAAAAAAAAAIDWSVSPWPQLVARLKEESGRSGRALFHPLRLALTGRDSGPEMAILLPLIGRGETLSRLRAAASVGEPPADA
jgi:glutamyl-tRNA synthetase